MAPELRPAAREVPQSARREPEQPVRIRPVADHIVGVVLQVHADAGKLVAQRDAMAREFFPRPDTREQQLLRRAEHARAQNGLAPRTQSAARGDPHDDRRRRQRAQCFRVEPGACDLGPFVDHQPLQRGEVRLLVAKAPVERAYRKPVGRRQVRDWQGLEVTLVQQTAAGGEQRVALEEWLTRIPEFQLEEPARVTWSEGTVRGPRQLPVVFGA